MPMQVNGSTRSNLLPDVRPVWELMPLPAVKALWGLIYAPPLPTGGVQ